MNLMHFSIFKKLRLGEAKPTTFSLQLAELSITYPRGLIEDVHVKIYKFILSTDFIVLDMEDDEISPILGRTFLAMGRTLIDVRKVKLVLRFKDEQVTFDLLKLWIFLMNSILVFK